MNIFFVGQIIPQELMNRNYAELKGLCDNAANVFYNALLEGFVKNGCGVSAVSTVSSGTNTGGAESVYKCAYYHADSGMKKHIKLFIKTWKEMKKWSKSVSGERAAVCNCLRISRAAAGILFCKLHGIKITAVVTDVPGYRSTKRRNMNLISKTADIVSRFMLSKYDAYVLLSEQMRDVIPMGNKKYCIVEGICGKFLPKSAEKNETFTVMYAGALVRKYNIGALAEAVIKLECENVVLKLFGAGEMEEELKRLESENPCIKFCGSVPNDICVKEEMRAHLLVNPRLSCEEYTKYSFPSKNIEYMKTGTPVLFTKLPSMPEEYSEYVNLIEDETADGIADAILRLMNTEYAELKEKAERAKRFVETEKNSEVQAGKVIKILKEICKKK